MSENSVNSQNNTDISVPHYNDITESYLSAMKVVDDVVLKNYIYDLSKMEIVPLKESILKYNLRDNVLFFKISEMVYEKDEFASYKFASVFNALITIESTIFLIIDSNGTKTDFYIGVRSVDDYRTVSSLRKTVKNSLKGQFPGIKTQDYTIDEMQKILDTIKTTNISSVTSVANNRSQDTVMNQNFVQGMEKLVLSMQEEKYTGIIIANATSQSQLKDLRKGYESVYTQLSPFSNSQVNYSRNSSYNYSTSKTIGSSQSNTRTLNTSETSSQSRTSSTSATHGESKENIQGKMVKSIGLAASSLGMILSPLTGGASLAIGGIISGGAGLLGSVLSKTVSDSTSTSNSETNGISTTTGESIGTTDTESNSISDTTGYTNGTSKGVTLTLHDKSIENILARIDNQLKRIDEFESMGMYECAAYFLSDTPYAAEMAATTYKALMCGENSGVESSAINSWNYLTKQKTQTIGEYIKNFIHPVFKYNTINSTIDVTPCSLVSGNELAIHMGLPRHSVCGLPVIEHSDFGKEVMSYNQNISGSKLNLGKIFNMGSDGNSKVSLNLNSLNMHTFITGSTGSGKSNTVYEIIRQLDNFGINYLIIEPAKGEYKSIFGNKKDVHVLGTNPEFTDMLRINPFRFPKGVHVLEHIDRLVEIFNVCWPMYAAMPAVLKDAILQSYQSCGWDLSDSVNCYFEELFPTFSDLLEQLVDVLNKSQYSEEVKSNYIGSLVTRVKSLTNGINGQIFVYDEIGDENLFDNKVIVDISRIGSSETKSLIMGILIMRLNEYRMSHYTKMNSPLKHITVLEEAHNILKRTNTEQSTESSNMTGKSVEMISNSIAEMRTYGEGFIIVDQSPSAVDISAIRNTNTKIIMRLPEESDRRISGKAAAMKDNQLDEIARLPKGVAAVYQNDWIEPVLCKINKFEGLEVEYIKPSLSDYQGVNKQFNTILINMIAKNRLDKTNIDSVDKINLAIRKSNCAAKTKILLFSLLDEYRQTNKLSLWKDENFARQSLLVKEVLGLNDAVNYARKMSVDFDSFNCYLNTLVSQKIDIISDEILLNVNHCLLKAYSETEVDGTQYYKQWHNDIIERRKFI
ncbi:helicase HerA domain-containing protein [Peptoanaerobacter stomatis]|uniref:ATP-binding protein n=1 Tax=Peptoanaerobacter stomatis TaxID=796937 RepID=UPI003F9F1F28